MLESRLGTKMDSLLNSMIEGVRAAEVISAPFVIIYDFPTMQAFCGLYCRETLLNATNLFYKRY